MEMSRGGGAQGGSWRRVTSCAQASQWGLRVSPGKGLGTFERVRDGEIGGAVVRRSAAGSDGQSQWSIRHSHTRAGNINGKKKRLDTMAKPPHRGDARGILPDFRGTGVTRKIQVDDPMRFFMLTDT